MGDIYAGDNVLIWIFYLCTTLFTQLTFFNMLIGIMGQTFERVTEARDRNSLKERTKMYADFLWVIKLDKQFKNQRYLYLVTPEDDASSEVEGSITGVKRGLQRLEKNLGLQLAAQAQKITTDVADFQVTSMNTLNDKISEVSENNKQFSKKFDLLESQFKHVIQLLEKNKQ